MNVQEAMAARHGVRQYKNQALTAEAIAALRTEIEAYSEESGLHIQLVTNEPKAFDGFMAHYGKFSGVTNYLALIGKKGPELEQKCGYYCHPRSDKAWWSSAFAAFSLSCPCSSCGQPLPPMKKPHGLSASIFCRNTSTPLGSNGPKLAKKTAASS